MRKRLHVITWGCQMNVYDSGRMADVLAPLGYAPADGIEDADMVILNTCHIRERAAEKLFSELGRLRLVKQARAASGQSTILAVAGCVAQAEGAEILARAPYVDIVLGPQTYHRLPQMVAEASRAIAAVGASRAIAAAGASHVLTAAGASRAITAAGASHASTAVIDTDFPVESKFDHLPEASAPPGLTAFLSIQEGCDKFCSFCVVPFTRGAEMSRPAAAVLAEARRLVAAGARELTLLGQNVNAWHGAAPDPASGATWGLGRLVHALAEIPDLLRIRYTTSHPRDMGADLIAAHRDVPQLMPFLHLPVQSGSDAMLARMNRRHTADDYRRLVDRLRAARPDLALSSDFIVGHPGETEADHAASLALIREVGFAQAFSFKYSPRPGTVAASAPLQVAEAVKDERLQSLQALLRDQQHAFNRACEGLTVPVLFTGPGRRPNQAGGRSPYLQPVHIELPPGLPAAALVGRETAVTILTGHPNSLSATLDVAKYGPANHHQERACA